MYQVIKLLTNKRGAHLYLTFSQQHGPYGVVGPAYSGFHIIWTLDVTHFNFLHPTGAWFGWIYSLKSSQSDSRSQIWKKITYLVNGFLRSESNNKTLT